MKTVISVIMLSLLCSIGFCQDRRYNRGLVLTSNCVSADCVSYGVSMYNGRTFSRVDSDSKLPQPNKPLPDESDTKFFGTTPARFHDFTYRENYKLED